MTQLLHEFSAFFALGEELFARFAIPGMLLLLIALVVVMFLFKREREEPLNPGAEQLQHAWSVLNRLEARIAVLEAIIIERCGAKTRKDYAGNISVYKSQDSA